jgi:hypothetical protein
MSDPSLLLQGAVFAALRANGALPAVVAGRIYDEVPPVPTFPYVTVGDGQIIGDDTEDCGDGSEIFIQVDAWSRAVGYPEVKSIAAAIRTALKIPIALSGFEVSVIQFQQCQYLRDPDGKTRHAAIQFRYLITHNI